MIMVFLGVVLRLNWRFRIVIFSLLKDCPEEWERGMSAGLLDPMMPMDTIFVKHVRENGPAVKAGLSTGKSINATAWPVLPSISFFYLFPFHAPLASYLCGRKKEKERERKRDMLMMYVLFEQVTRWWAWTANQSFASRTLRWCKWFKRVAPFCTWSSCPKSKMSSNR